MHKPLIILLAEDNEDDIFLLQEAFRKAKATSRLCAVSDGVQAQTYLKGEGEYADRVKYPFPDMLLLDLNMPRMNGIELLEWIRKDEQCQLLVVEILTASARQTDVERAYALGANGYSVKPSRVDELVAFVSAFHAWHHFTVFPETPKLAAH